jgi:hypothetical protein
VPTAGTVSAPSSSTGRRLRRLGRGLDSPDRELRGSKQARTYDLVDDAGADRDS